MRSTVVAAADADADAAAAADVAADGDAVLQLVMRSCGSRWPSGRASASTWSDGSTPGCVQCSYSAGKRTKKNTRLNGMSDSFLKFIFVLNEKNHSPSAGHRTPWAPRAALGPPASA